MKAAFLAIPLVTAVLTLLPAQNANAADDYKMYAGSGCKVFGSTAWTDLQFGARGVTNLASGPRNIICPLIKDSETNWTGGSGGFTFVQFHLTTGNNTQDTTCNAYVVNANGTLHNTYSTALGGIANTEFYGIAGYLDSGAVEAGIKVHATILCTLAPGSRLNFYFMKEDLTTDNF